MLRFFRSVQRLVLFVGVLACRCATTNGRSERQPAFVDPPEAVMLKVRPVLALTVLLAVGCSSIQRLAVNQVGDALAKQGEVFASDDPRVRTPMSRADVWTTLSPGTLRSRSK